MYVVAVDSPDDPRLGDYTNLTDVAARRLREPAEGLFIAESALVIERALGAGYEPRSVLTCARWLEQLGNQPGLDDAPVYVADDELLRAVTGYRVHRGALSSMSRRPLPDLVDLLGAVDRVAILEDIVDHTNVGAIFRSAAALGVQAVVVSPKCADPLYRRSVRVSMGSVFALPWTRAQNWPTDLDAIRHAGLPLWGLTPGPGSIPLDEVRRGGQHRWALMFGTEGAGLTAAALERADELVRIPMHSGIDSLNVAAASAVAFYALSDLRSGAATSVDPTRR
jgi:tRNA G18 (ribose-2'-O)-methylase SpoU